VTLTDTRPAEPGPAGPQGEDLLAAGRSGGGDQAFKLVALVAGLTVLAILALIAFSTTREALPAFRDQGLGFLTGTEWIPNKDTFGAVPFIFGTLVTSLIALVVAVPISLGIALFTTEVAHRRIKRPVTYVMDLLAAIPSVVYGLWGILVLAPAIQPLYQGISDVVDGWPVLGALFGGVAQGRSFMTAGLILAIMIIPIITTLSREVIAAVPAAQREAAYGMGATRWEMIRSAIFPWAQGGIVGAIMLGLGRAMGETIAVALVIGSTPQITSQLFSSGDSMPAVIANQFGEAGSLHRSALIGLGVVLFCVTIVVNVGARSIVRSFDRRLKGE
jgi:phosphate transport system permease protein